ncbi:DUF2272 domain-containing protein [Tistrella sp. BH-R2-4]|uniref:DUF2272 domain-containing protein n=1 Tax=Tistrella arctica TaxID=3133430 RepID=A0ABU9YJA2_9PROT
MAMMTAEPEQPWRRVGRGAAATLAAALLLSACAGGMPGADAPRAAPLACAPQPPAGGMVPAMVAAAEAEWRAFGQPVVDFRGGAPALNPAGLDETDSRVRARLQLYWRAASDDHGLKMGASDVPELSPWSAAFISYVACAAGVSPADLPPASRHLDYVDHVIFRAIRTPDDPTARFVPAEPMATALRPGDLLCADRGRSDGAPELDRWEDRAAEVIAARQSGWDTRPRGMHCDLVVRVGPGTIAAIGGNVRDRVAMSLFPADPLGRPVPVTGTPHWFVTLAAIDR